MKKMANNRKKIRIILGIIILLLIIVFILFIIKKNKLNVSSKLTEELYSYVGGSKLEVCNGLSNYDKKEITFNDLENSVRICNSYELLDNTKKSIITLDENKDNTCNLSDNIEFATDNYEDDVCTISKISSDIINDQYQKIYGKSIENYENFQYDATTICYYEDGYYYCGLATSYTITIGSEPRTYRTIKDVQEQDNKIVIYDYFVKVENDECYTSYNDETKNDDCTKHYDSNKKINYSFLKKYGTLFKHTFEKNKDGYYWIKSEPVK